MITRYEVTYTIKPDTGDEAKKAVVDKYDKVTADNGVAMIESKDWGKHRSIYEISKYRGGTHHITTFTAENAKAVGESGRLSRIDDRAPCSMIVKLDK